MSQPPRLPTVHHDARMAGSAGDPVDNQAAAHRVAQLFFLAHRGLTGEANAYLRDLGLGRAHYRVLYFAARLPGVTVGEMLDILDITAQGVARVLNRLLDEGYLRQETDRGDRRRRRLYVTEAGARLERDVFARQAVIIDAAIAAAGAGAQAGFAAMMMALISADDRVILDRLGAATGGGEPQT